MSAITAMQGLLAADDAPPAATHRYWRLLITQNDGSGSFCGLTELELRGTVGGADITANDTDAPVSASSEINASNKGSNAFDNVLTSGWLSNTPATSWLQWDFVTQGIGAQAVAQIAIRGSHNAPTASPRDFELQWSDDNVSFTTALTVTGETGWTGASDIRVFTV